MLKRLTFPGVAGECPPPPVGLRSRSFAAVGFHTWFCMCESVFPCYSVNFHNKRQTAETSSLSGVPAERGRRLSGGGRLACLSLNLLSVYI